MASAPTEQLGHAAAAEQPSPHRPRAAFALLGTVQVTLIAAMTVIAVALSTIQSELRINGSWLALVNNAYPVAFCGLLLFGGRLGDLFGRRNMFVLGTAIFAVGSAAAGLAPSLVPLLLARFTQGCGAALAAPAAMALLNNVFPDPQTHKRAVALWGALPVTGATLGLLLSGVVVEWADWRVAFGPPVVIALVACALARYLLPRGEPSSRQPLDIPGAVLATVSLSALCYALVTAGEQGWTAPNVLVSLVVGAALLAAFFVVESRIREPLVPPRFLASLPRATGLVAVVLASAVTTAVAYFLPLYFQQARGYSPAETSAAFIPYALAMFAAGWFGGRILLRLGHRIATVAGLLVGAVGLLLLSGIDVGTPYAGPLLIGLLVLPVGASLLFAGGTVAAVDQVPDHQAGLAGGVLNTAMEGGPAMGFACLVSLSAAYADELRQAGADPAAALSGGYGFALGAAAVAYVVLAVFAAITLRSASTGRT